MNNEYNELLFWKVFKNNYLLNCILKNKCCYKSKKFKTITSIDSMLKHKQYQLLICKLKADENLYFKGKYGNDEIINRIEDIEVFKEIYSLLLFKGYQDTRDHRILFDSIWGIKSVDLFDFHLKYHPEELQTHITTSIYSILVYNHPKLIIKVLNFFKESINHNKPITLTKNERNYFIMEYLYYCRYGRNIEELKEKMKMIWNIPISSTSIFHNSEKRVPSANVGCFLKYQKLLPFGFNNIQTSFDCSKENPRSYSSIGDRRGDENNQRSVYSINHLNMFSSFCYDFDDSICEYIKDVKGNFECISSSIKSVLLYFKLYYCNYDYKSKSKSIPTSIQTQIDIIIENSKHRRCTVYQSIKQLFQLLAIESKSIVLYAFYLKEYNEPIDTIELSEEIQLLLIYYMIKTYNTNILKFLLKKHLKIKLTKLDLDYIGESYLKFLFKSKQINKNNIIMFYKNYTSQKSIIIEDLDEKPLDDAISTKELIDLDNKRLHSILGNESSSKWKEITSNIIDNDMIVTIKDKETIDWLSDIETGGGCSILKIRDALNSKLKQMKLDFSTLELLEYARIKFKQVIPILDLNKELCNIHILRTHDDIESLINRLNQSNFNNNENLFKYYMIQIIQFGSRNSMKYLRLICDSIDELLMDYEGWVILDDTLRRFYINSYLIEGEIWDNSVGYHENKKFKEYKIPTQQTCQIINLTKIKVNFNHFPNVTSYLLQTFIELLNFEGVQFILDNLNGKNLKLNEKAFKDRFHDRIYTCKYLYKDLIEMIQFLINKFKDGQLSLSNLSLILNFLFSMLIRVNDLTNDQIKTAYQSISNYIEIDSSELNSYYYLKTLSPIISSCIIIFRDNGGGDVRPLLEYHIDTSVYTFEHIFTNRNNNDLNQFIDSTIMDIVKDRFYSNLNKMLDNNNPRINLFLHYFEIQLKYKNENDFKGPFLNYKLLKLIIKTFDLESFIKLDSLLENHNGNCEQEGSNNRILSELEKFYFNWKKPLSSNMVEWFGIIVYKDYSDYQDIINYLFNKYKHQLEPYIIYYKLKINNKSITNNQLHSILCNKSSSKWKEITSNLIGKAAATIKDKETIDWLSDIETGGCSNLKIRDALHSRLNHMELDFSSLELLEYARIKFKQIISIFDLCDEFFEIHILHTHDEIESLINRLNQSNFNENEDLFKNYMIQIIEFGSRLSAKHIRSIFKSLEYGVDKSSLGNDNYKEWKYLINKVFKYEYRRFFDNPSYIHEEYFLGQILRDHKNEEYKEYNIPTRQESQIINLSKIKVNFNHFANVTSYLFQGSIELLNFEGVQFILDNLNGKDLKLNEKAFKDHFHDRIYSCEYVSKDLYDTIQFLIEKFEDGQLSLSNLSLILNYLFSKLIRVNDLTIDQINISHQLISNYIEIDSSKYNSYYYLKILSPIIESCITVIEGPTSDDEDGNGKPRPFCHYDIDTSVYTFEHIFTNRNNNDQNQFIDSTIMDIVKDNFTIEIFSKMLDNNNPRINLFLHYFEMELKKRKTSNDFENVFLEFEQLKLIIKTFDLESFIKFEYLLQQYQFYLSPDIDEWSDINKEYANDQEDINDGYVKPLSSNLVEWFGKISFIYYPDYPDILNYLFDKYKNQFEPYTNYIN
ncbi:hypothetical protein DDB_G0276559 [Dictyostelium discoideum AX4]|uniref:Uncharacterized protein n=1 Tax=Dictyostelium discoideum TaxID=44689 RepID=Q551L0_DICDI|nr:hypothetical protein DDB_G0276559 [Dictyostelium discoideum AX4]EAL69233.1 hypothetical protein DDB_G0276559 [Dictyostelium discoideum AX4]|eukprot:XP_643124.1 hypothetical protein DDB_G0276559 [Dictyostelium discoideum AX4]